MRDPLNLKLSAREVTLRIAKEMASPAMLVTFALVGLIRFYLPALVYVCLRLVEMTGGATFDWLILLAAVAAGVVSCWLFFRQVSRSKKSFRELRRRIADGDESARSEYLALRNRGARGLWRMSVMFVSIQLVIAPSVAIGVWADMREAPGITKSAGHYRRTTPSEELRKYLHYMESRGINRWTS